MFKVGDLVELDMESMVNKNWDGSVSEEEMKYLASKGLYPNTAYEIERDEADQFEDQYLFLKTQKASYGFMSERFKLAAPLNLENE